MFGIERFGMKELHKQLQYLFISIIIIVSTGTVLTGCQKKPSKDVSIQLENIESDGAEIPRFVSEDEDVQRELEKLNIEVDDLKERYLDETADGKQFWIRTYVSQNTEVLQCTICWFEEHPILGNNYNMMTLAYNTKTGDALTSKDALDSMNIDGVELSINVGRAFKNSGINGQLDETNMQGFVMDSNGNVTEVYMKLTVLMEEDEEPEQHFFIYNDEEETLKPVKEEGYDMP